MRRRNLPEVRHCDAGTLAMAIIAIVLAALALAVAGCCVITTRWFLARVTDVLGQPPQFAKAKLTAAEERAMREGFHEALRHSRRRQP